MKTVLRLFALMAILNAPIAASAQEVADHDKGLADTGAGAPQRGSAAEGKLALALGFTMDALPIILSATEGQVGASGQVWIGIDQLRMRLVGARFRQPDWLASKKGFQDLDTAVVAAIFDYVSGDHFDEWWVGTGFELWQNSIAHEDAGPQRAVWSNLVWTLGGGYIWRVAGNFYVEPWVAFHVLMNRPDVVLADQHYDTLPLMAEFSLKLGWFFEL